jgi:hypothetical protein
LVGKAKGFINEDAKEEWQIIRISRRVAGKEIAVGANEVVVVIKKGWVCDGGVMVFGKSNEVNILED